MGQKTSIAWCHHTFSPWHGCTKVSPGCLNCYAEKLSNRFNPGLWGPNAGRKIAGDRAWAEPLRWDRAAAKAGERRRVFCGSMCDVFEDRPDLIRARIRLFEIIATTPRLDWLLLTKRPDHAAYWWDRITRAATGESLREDPWPNVWLGVSVEDQQRSDERIPILLSIPAAVRFLSVEPLLGPVNLSPWLSRGLHWVIAGGESGPSARPCRLEWIRDLVRQCRDAGVSCFVKQLGANLRGLSAAGLDHDVIAKALGSTYHLQDPKGGDPSQWPEDLRIREFPREG